MKHVDEFRDPGTSHGLANAIARITTRPWTIMEICGGQTHAIVRHGIDRMLPDGITLLHGPGCPVCVTPPGMIDAAITIASRPDVILCCFGDMLRVPGNGGSLLSARAQGADVRMVYAPVDAVTLAHDNPHRQVVFFAVGFETTAPGTAMAVLCAERERLNNFSLLVSHVLVPPAIAALLSDPACCVQGFLAAGHVCTVAGCQEYEQLASRFNIPIVITGFEPLDLLQGLYQCIRQLEEGRAELENPYSRMVRPEGNQAARAAMETVFRVHAQDWRGMGRIEASGLGLSRAYVRFDALARFAGTAVPPERETRCISGEVLRGNRKPADCPAFGTDCLPERPLGATMVSSEGACAAYFRYRKPQSAT